MTLIDCLGSVTQTIRDNMFRSGLTTLGIVISVASVIVLGAVGSGARDDIDRQVGKFGANVLTINASARMVNRRSNGPGTNLPLSEHDLRAVARKVDSISGISGQLWASATVVRDNINVWTRIWGVHDQYMVVWDREIEQGREIVEQDVASARRVAVLGATVARSLFGDEDAVGKSIRIRNAPFVVVGTMVHKGQSGLGWDYDDVILIPITTARQQVVGKNSLVQNPVGQIGVKLFDGADLTQATEQIEQAMRVSRRLHDGAEDNFIVGNLSETMRARMATQSTMSWLLAISALVSLVVSGVGVMNIMLVSITERTREIGVRIAVGARRFDVLRQFLMEAAVLCLIGGIIGAGVGSAAAFVAAHVAGWPVHIRPESIGFAVAAAGTTGIAFGYLPARRAAQVNPIDALRAE